MSAFRATAAIAALAGAGAVIVGAFATHGIADERVKNLFEIGARYQFMHAMAMIAALLFWRWGGTRARFSAAAFLGGMILFCGSLYGLALGAPRVVGAITPLGGLLLIAGWLILAWSALQLRDETKGGS